MVYRVYIQSLNNFPLTDWMVSAYLGFKEKGTEVILFEEIEEVPTSKYNIVVAYSDFALKYFERLGFPPMLSLNMPKEIERFADRAIERTTMGVLKDGINEGLIHFPVFIKPDGIMKKFVAGVVSSKSNALVFFDDVADDEPVLLSSVVDFVSEYRGYVIDGELVGIKHYIGDFRIFPDMKVIDQAISEYKSQPAGYSIDFGVTDDGRTLLIECNDGWSLGNYGLEDRLYSKLLGIRWRQLMTFKQ